MTTFSELGLSEEILKVLPELGIDEPSEIQQKAIPILLNNNTDFIGLAQTGTGKTAAFGLPLLHQVDLNNRNIQAVVLAPTRELCLQITDQLLKFSKYRRGLYVEAVYGGANIVPQMKALKRGVHVVVATPGRLIDLLNRKALSFDTIERVVLDEADEMLNMGFREDIDEILTHTPSTKKTWLFSATMSKGIRKIVEQYMDQPEEITIGGKQAVNKNIEHQYLLAGRSKRDSLKHYMDVHDNVRGIVFCKTKIETKELSDDLRAEGCSVDAINGDLSQAAREQVMKKFKSHKLDVLVATDVAARGIDVNDLTHVFHFNIPDDLEYYTHRSGRTARAGKKGLSILFLRRSDQRKIKFLERSLNIEFQEIQLPGKKDVAKSKTIESIKALTESEPQTAPSDISAEITQLLENLSKEELVEKLISAELTRFGFFAKEPKESDDREKRISSRDDRDDRKPRREGGRERSSSDRGDRGDRGNRRSDRDNDRRPKREEGTRFDRADRRERERGDQERGGRDRDREPRSPRNFDRYLINVGKADGVRKLDILDFVCEQSGLDKRSIGDIDLDKQHSYFEVEKSKSKGIDAFFDGVEVNGRALKVTREDKSE